MFESRFWRQGLRADIAWLRRNRRFQRWSEKKVVLYERHLMLVAFQIRTLLERPKVGHRTRNSRVEGRVYKRLGKHPVTLMNVMDVAESFDLDHPQVVQLPIFEVCNQLVHHYLLAVLPNGAHRFEELWVFSDWKRNVCLYEFKLDRVLEVFARFTSEASAFGADGSGTIRWDDKRQDYVFSTAP